MPVTYTIENGRLVLSGSQRPSDHHPQEKPKPQGFTDSKPKPKPKPTPSKNKPKPKPTQWWQHPIHALANELRWAAKQAGSLNKGINLISGSAANPLMSGDPVYQDTSKSAKNPTAYSGSTPLSRQVTAAIGPGSIQTAGEGIISLAGAANRFRGRGPNSVETDPRSTLIGRGLNAATRAAYDVLGAKQPEDLTPDQRGVVETQGRMVGGAVIASVLGGPIGGLAKGATGLGIKAIPALARIPGQTALGVGRDLAVHLGIEGLIQDTPVLGNSADMVAALTGMKNIPFAANPEKPALTRAEAAAQSIVPNAALGFAIGIPLGLAGKAFRNLRENRRVARDASGHAATSSALETGGLTTPTETGGNQFTEQSSQIPEPLITPPPKPAAAGDTTGQSTLDQIFGPHVTDPAGPPPPDAPSGGQAPTPLGQQLPADAAPIPSQAAGDPYKLLDGELPDAADPATSPWEPQDPSLYDPALPEVNTVYDATGDLSPAELRQLATGNGPVLDEMDQIHAARAPAGPNPGMNLDMAWAPTKGLSPLYLEGMQVPGPGGKASGIQPWSEQIAGLPTETLLSIAHPENNSAFSTELSQTTGKSWEQFSRQDVLDGLQAASDNGKTMLPSRLGGDRRIMRTEDIYTDPATFQHRTNTGKTGTQAGHYMNGLTTYDPNVAQPLKVFDDPITGKTYIADGHHSLALARRTGMPTMEVRHVNATTPEGARAEAAQANIANGSASVWEAATFIRDTNITNPGQLQAYGFKSKLAEEGLAISKLPPDVVKNGVEGAYDNRKPGDSSAKLVDLGASGLDETKMRFIANKLLANSGMSTGKFNEWIDAARASGNTVISDDGRLPGFEEAIDTMGPLVDLASQVRSKLGSSKRIFGGAAKQTDRLNTAGDTNIDTAAAKTIAEQSAKAMALFDQLKYATGPINELLKQGAEEIAKGAKINVIAARIEREIGGSLEKELGKPPAARPNEAVTPDLFATPPSEPAPTPAAQPAEAVTPDLFTTPPAQLDPAPTPPAIVPGPTVEEMRLHAVQRAIANGEVRPTETLPPEPGLTPTADLNAVGKELQGVTEATTLNDLPATRQALADELALAAAKKTKEAEVQWQAERVKREAEGYDYKTFDQKMAEGMGQQLERPWKPTTAENTPDTRGQGRFFHGTAKEIPGDTPLGIEDTYSDTSIFGNGFYTTDDFHTAGNKYTQKGKNATRGSGSGPVVYEVIEKTPVKFFDLDRQIPWDEQSPEAAYFRGDGEKPSRFWNEVLGEWEANGSMSYGEIMDEARAISRDFDYSRADVIEYFDDFNSGLEQKFGYGGATHEGGNRAGNGKRLHTVKIYWEPEKQIELRRIGADGPSAPPTAAPAAPKKLSLTEELSKLGPEPPVNPEGNLLRAAGNSDFKLSPALSKSSPRYGTKQLDFQSDYDRTAYILFNDANGKGSKAAAKFRAELEAAGLNVEATIAHGAKVKAAIKEGARNVTGNVITVPVQEIASKRLNLPPEAHQSKLDEINKAMDENQKKASEGGCDL